MNRAVRDDRLTERPTEALRCAECDAEAMPGAKGWRAVLTVGDEVV